MYRFDTPVASLWEATAGPDAPPAPALSGDQQCDVAVIGAGYTGLSAAYHLARDRHADVRVLEAGHLGWGASGRNGGFCSIGGEGLGAEGMARRYGIEAVRHYYRAQVDAVGLVRQLIDDERIDAEVTGDAEVAISCSARGLDHLREHAGFCSRELGLDVRVLAAGELREQFFDSPLQHGGLVLRPTFGLHPLRYLRGLARATAARGVALHAGSEVLAWSRDGDRHLLATRGGTLRARRVIVATNGFAPEHLRREFRGTTLPLISSILVTRPLTAMEIDAQRWRTDAPSITWLNLLNYFRLLPDGRFLFGGRGSSDGSDANAARNQAELTARFHAMFPAWREVGIDYRWHGLVCMTRRRTPAIGCLDDDPTVYFAFGYHGNGVNTATWAGLQLARWVASGGTRAPDSVPGVMCGLAGRFPLPGLRLRYIQAAIAVMRLADRAG